MSERGAINLTLTPEGKATVQLSEMTIETRSQALTLSAQLARFAEMLPETKPRQRKSKQKSSRQTGSRVARKAAKNGDAETADAAS